MPQTRSDTERVWDRMKGARLVYMNGFMHAVAVGFAKVEDTLFAMPSEHVTSTTDSLWERAARVVLVDVGRATR